MSMKRIFLVVAVGVFMIILPLLSSKIEVNNQKEENSGQQIENKDNKEVAEYKIKSGDTFTNIVGAFQVPYNDALAILNSSKEVFDFTKIQTGKILKVILVNKVLAAVEYPLSSDEVVVVEKQDDGFKASTKPIPYQIQNVTAEGIISSSLFATAQDAGIEDKVTIELADVFSSDIDFATDIREGDSFSVVYEKRLLDGKDVGAGNILAARFTNDEKNYTAFRYNDKFYNEKGEAMTRQFLKSPLNYARISSGFSYKRTNPVTKRVTPHRAIDYAASAGTPVIATADGKVTIAGSKGDLGVTVEIKHGNYLTQYAHLSSIAKGIKKGVDLAQGDIVGYVGSTGISTGPHLQYAVFKNGSPINPLTTDFSRGESLKESELATFINIRDKFQKLVN